MKEPPTTPFRLCCPHCMDDLRLVVLKFDLMLMWYACPVCMFRLPDEDIYRAAPTSKM